MKLLGRLDWPILAAQLSLLFIGLLLLCSLDQSEVGAASQGLWGPLVRRQLQALGPGLLLFVVAVIFDYRWLRLCHWATYGLGVLGVLAVLHSGVSAKGAQRWLDVGSLGAFQPSEPVKLCVVITLAAVLCGSGGASLSWSRLLRAMAVPLVPALAILRQPDLGTAVVLGAVALMVVYLAGASPWRLVALVVPVLLLLGAHLRGYQRERLLVFLDPDRDPTGAGWNLIQARLAVGGGHFWGQGLFAGAQKQLHFVPEQHTDFIFTVAGEELGWVGSLAILGLFGTILWRGFRIARRAQDPFGSLLASGICCLLAIHVAVNVGMVVGLLPVVGVPLPLLSSGGSNLWTALVGLGLLQSVEVHRRVILEPRGLVPQAGLERDLDRRTVMLVRPLA